MRLRDIGTFVFIFLGLVLSACEFSPSEEQISKDELETMVARSVEATTTTEAEIQTQVAVMVAEEIELAPDTTDQDLPTSEEFDDNMASLPPLQLPTYVPRPETVVTAIPVTVQPPPEPAPPTDTPVPPADTPVPVTDTPVPSPYGDLSGRIVFTRNLRGHEDSGHEIYVLDLGNGDLSQLTFNNIPDWDPDWSPDGQLITYVSFQTGNYDIWVMDADGGGQTNRIALPAWDDYPVWSPDGTQFAFVSTGMTEGVANSEVFLGSDAGTACQVTFNTGADEWPSWAPDGLWLASSSNRDGDFDIFLFAADGSSTIQWTNDPGFDEQPSWSPDGQWIAFVRKTTDTNGNGRLDRRDDGDYGDLWIGRQDGSEFRQLTFDGRVADPAWSPDGKQIVFAHFKDSNGDGLVGLHDASDLWIIPVSGGTPIVLVEGPEQDWSPDWTW